MKRTHLTLQDLIDNNACEYQRDLFTATFGQSAKIGPRNMSRAIKAGLEVSWLERMIPAAALAEYEKARAPAWAEYNKVRAAALAEYNKVRAQALAEYDKVTDAAWGEYDKVRAAGLVRALTGEVQS